VPDPRETGDLVRAAADGDQGAWDILVQRHAGLIWSVGHRFGLSAADIADLAQTVWLILVQHLGKLREPEYLGRWLVTTTRRECLRMLHKQAHEVPSDLAAELDNAVDINQRPVEHALLARERDATVRAAFATLPERCQQLLRLLMRDPPLAYQEVAARLGTTVGYIGPTRGRCLKILRQVLDSEH
jgi:RNA polymerase sigma factor (sigma-70 family)